MSDERSSPLSRYLLVVYALLTIYASLYPFSGWRDLGVGAFHFLGAPRPRNVLLFDLVANVLGYVPLGLLAVLALHPRVRGWLAVLVACAGSAALSLVLEALQSFLPARIPSNVDVMANAAGAALGALAAVGPVGRMLRAGALQALRERWFRRGGEADLGLVILGLWLVTLLNPETLLFGNGDLRGLLNAPLPGEHYPPVLFIRVEAFVAGANVVAAGMLLALLTARGQSVRWLFLALAVLALAVRSFAYGVFFRPPSMFLWLTPGAGYGAAAGILVVLAAARIPRPYQMALCGLAILAATAVVNLAPTNPYTAASLAAWRQGHFLNFNGLTRLLSAAWPFIALAYLLVLGTGRRRARLRTSGE